MYTHKGGLRLRRIVRKWNRIVLATMSVAKNLFLKGIQTLIYIQISLLSFLEENSVCVFQYFGGNNFNVFSFYTSNDLQDLLPILKVRRDEKGKEGDNQTMRVHDSFLPFTIDPFSHLFDFLLRKVVFTNLFEA